MKVHGIERHHILGNSVVDDDVGKGGRAVEGCRKYLVSRIEMNTIEFTIMIRMVIFLDNFLQQTLSVEAGTTTERQSQVASSSGSSSSASLALLEIAKNDGYS